jgi:hypothetical protein
MRHFGNRARTRNDRSRDLQMFLSTARPDKILSATPDELSRRYGTDPRETECALLAAQGRVMREGVGS